MTPYGDIDLGQHWLRQRLVAWQHQDVSCTNVELSSASVGSSDIHPIAISGEMPKSSITKISLKMMYLKFHYYLSGANELNVIHAYTGLVLGLRPANERRCNNVSHWLGTNLESACIAGSRLAPTQWGTSLQSNTVSHWLVARIRPVYGSP